jgi:hypothetical protein
VSCEGGARVCEGRGAWWCGGGENHSTQHTSHLHLRIKTYNRRLCLCLLNKSSRAFVRNGGGGPLSSIATIYIDISHVHCRATRPYWQLRGFGRPRSAAIRALPCLCACCLLRTTSCHTKACSNRTESFVGVDVVVLTGMASGYAKPMQHPQWQLPAYCAAC